MFTTPFAFMAAPAGGGTLLLDIYPGAKRAYSVRKLSSSYSGPALRVRRSSDDTEQDIGFVGEDLDTSALTTFVGANNGFITTFYDQSGNGVNATQTTAANQPTIISSGTLYTVGTKPAIYTLAPRAKMNFTQFFTTNVTQYFVGRNNGANPMAGFGGNNTTLLNWSRIYFQWKDYYAESSSAYTSSTDQILLASTLSSGSDSIIYRNGSVISKTNNPIGVTDQYDRIFLYAGGFGSDEGLFNELVLWDSDQSANAPGINSNVNSYYSIY